MRTVKTSSRLAIAAAIFTLLASPRSQAIDGDVVLRTDNGADGYYYGLSGTGEDRFISEYLAGTYGFDAVICGARVRELNLGRIPPPGRMGGELRFEDPLNVGYPDLSPVGLIAEVDPESTGTCSTSSAQPRFFTFGGGAGIVDPRVNHYICAIEPLQGTTGTLDFCGVLLDRFGPWLKWSKVYERGWFHRLPWNHFVELIVLDFDLFAMRLRPHGTPRFPGDTGRPVVFTTRANDHGSVTDDAVSLTIAIDNRSGGPIARNVEICADRSVFDPAKGLAPVTGLFRMVGGGPLVNPAVYPEGRTILRLEIPQERAKAALARRVDRSSVNLPLRVVGDDPATDTDPCRAEGAMAVNEDDRSLGLRRRAGSPDDGVADAYFVVQAPNAEGDALVCRHRATDLPTTVAFTVTGLEVVGGEFGETSGLPGLDAIELRTEDPIFSWSPDLAAIGLLASIGSADGVGEAPLPVRGAAAAFDLSDLTIDPTGARGLAPNLFVLGLFLPGEANPVTAIGADQVPGATLLGDSSYTESGILPVRYDCTSNYMLRILLDGDRSTLEGISGAPPDASEHACLRRVGEVIAIDRRTGRPLE